MTDVKLSKTQEKIYKAIKRSKSRGVINSQIAERTGIYSETSRPRLVELLDLGLIIWKGYRRNDDGNQEKLYIAA
jgi:predicted HTH transcriptional regulator